MVMGNFINRICKVFMKSFIDVVFKMYLNKNLITIGLCWHNGIRPKLRNRLIFTDEFTVFWIRVRIQIYISSVCHYYFAWDFSIVFAINQGVAPFQLLNTACWSLWNSIVFKSSYQLSSLYLFHVITNAIN